MSKNFYLSAKGIVRFKGVKKFLILTLNQILTTLSADFLRILADPRIGEVQTQSTEKERQLNASIAALNAANEVLSDKLSAAEARTQSEVAAHARTAESLQRETITRHTLEQQVADLKERLVENDAHGNLWRPSTPMRERL